MIDTGEIFLLCNSEADALAAIAEMDKALGYPWADSQTATCTQPIPSTDGTQWLVRLHAGIYSHKDKKHMPLEPMGNVVIIKDEEAHGKPAHLRKVTADELDQAKFPSLM